MITDHDKILDDLYENAKFYNCEGCEFTDEDALFVVKQQEEGKRYDDAINDTLEGIRNCLGW